MQRHNSALSPQARQAALAFALIVGVAGCTASGGGESGEGPPSEPQDAAVAAPEPTHGAGAAEAETPPAPQVATDVPSPVELAGGNEGERTQDVTDLDLSDRHQNGVVVTISQVTVAPTSMALEVSAVNGFPDQVRLNALSMYLVDDLGNAYNFSPPETNADLAIDPGAELTGTLVFLGRLDDQATSLDLKMNVLNADDSIDVANRLRVDTSPKMLIRDIPIPQ